MADTQTLETVKDIAVIVGAVLSPVIGALTAVWAYKRQDKERLNAALIWSWARDYQSGSLEEQPFLNVHNRSDKPVVVTDITYLKGSIWPKAERGTAIDYVDPTEIDFPYQIEPGKMHRFRLNPYGAKVITDKTTKFGRLARKLGRAPVWIELRTMAGTRLRLRAEDATPWRDRAEWLA
ncbi:MAG: hypothetical protein QOH47_3485 [Sphingomonadales bacterium]|nr:hypothetical protein [Sphingomonadales bacterium]